MPVRLPLPVERTFLSAGCHAQVLLGMLIALAICNCLRAADIIPPRPQGKYVNDNAGVLSPSTVADLNRRLQDFESQTSNQVLVVIYPKMQSDSDISDYAVRVAQAWGVGRKDRKNGVVLFIFTQDRKMTIQVGYGLEGAMPDAISKRIIEDEIKPHFRQNDYNSGVRAGVDAIMKATKGEYKGTGRALAGRGARAFGLFTVFFIVVAWLIIASWFRRVFRGTLYGSGGMYRRRGFGGFWPGYYIGGGFGRGGGGGSWGGGGGGGTWGGGGGGFSAGGGSFGGGGASGSW
jgi:uncharacterized protein